MLQGAHDQVTRVVDDHPVPWPLVHGEELAQPGDGVLVVDQVPGVGHSLLVRTRKGVVACTCRPAGWEAAGSWLH